MITPKLLPGTRPSDFVTGLDVKANKPVAGDERNHDG